MMPIGGFVTIIGKFTIHGLVEIWAMRPVPTGLIRVPVDSGCVLVCISHSNV